MKKKRSTSRINTVFVATYSNTLQKNHKLEFIQNSNLRYCIFNYFKIYIFFIIYNFKDFMTSSVCFFFESKLVCFIKITNIIWITKTSVMNTYRIGGRWLIGSLLRCGIRSRESYQISLWAIFLRADQIYPNGYRLKLLPLACSGT